MVFYIYYSIPSLWCALFTTLIIPSLKYNELTTLSIPSLWCTIFTTAIPSLWCTEVTTLSMPSLWCITEFTTLSLPSDGVLYLLLLYLL